MPSQWWSACYDETMKEANFAKSHNVIMGVDLSQRHDLTATTILIEDGGHFYCFSRFWIPEESAELKERKDKVPYTLWQKRKENNLSFCNGKRIQQEEIKEQIIKDIEFFGVREIRYDPTGAQLLMEQIEAETGIDVVAVTQSRPSLSPATVEIYNLIREKRLHHPNNDLLNWNVNNAISRPDNFNRILVEKGKCLQRVDGLISLIISYSYFTNYKTDYSGIMC
ncbi:MAG: terminase TerL endonuclease subunit [Planctomycetaceae bacterium]